MFTLNIWKSSQQLRLPKKKQQRKEQNQQQRKTQEKNPTNIKISYMLTRTFSKNINVVVKKSMIRLKCTAVCSLFFLKR